MKAERVHQVRLFLPQVVHENSSFSFSQFAEGSFNILYKTMQVQLLFTTQELFQ